MSRSAAARLPASFPENIAMVLTCRSLVYHLTDLEEGTLPAHDRFFATMHLALCSNCRRYRDQLLAARGALRALSDHPPGQTFAAFEGRQQTRPAERPDNSETSDAKSNRYPSGPPS